MLGARATASCSTVENCLSFVLSFKSEVYDGVGLASRQKLARHACEAGALMIG